MSKSLEGVMKGGLDKKISEMVSRSDKDMRSWVEQLAFKLNARAESGVESLKTHVQTIDTDAGSWQLPFAIFVVVVFGLIMAGYTHYKREQKKHLL